MPITDHKPLSGGAPPSPLPGAAEWGPETDDLDESYARRIFFGKSVQQTFPLFARNVIERASELRFMPQACFRYYLLAYRDYLLLDSTPQDKMAADAASCFFGLVLEKLANEPANILSLLPELLPTLRYLALYQDAYDADRDIYGDFSEKLIEVERLVREVSSVGDVGPT